MEGHTPGPWRVGDAGHTVFGPNLGKPSPEVIANLGAREGFRANARLIAAAPDMLAEIERAEFALEGAIILLNKQPGLASAGHMTGFRAALAGLRVARHKATGE